MSNIELSISRTSKANGHAWLTGVPEFDTSLYDELRKGLPMTIYVDNLNAEKDGKIWCHLLSDDFENNFAELHQFAQSIGLKRHWLHRSSIPHYDVTESMKIRALKAGAKEITKFESVKIMQSYRTKTMGNRAQRVLFPECPPDGATNED